VLDSWASANGNVHFIRPTKPTDNSFNGGFRDEFLGLQDAIDTTEAWRTDVDQV